MANPMLLHRIRLVLTGLLSAALVSACGGGGGSSAPAPTDVSVVAGDTQAVLNWTASSGVEYWLWYKAGDTVSPSDKTASFKLKVSPPYILTGLTNGTKYAFTINARTNDGPGGPGSSIVTATPALAGAAWTLGGALDTTAATSFRSVAYGLTTSGATTHSYVAVGDGGALSKSPAYTSTSALAWTPVATTGTTLDGVNLTGVLYALSKYIVVGAGGKVAHGTNISTWTVATSGTTSDLNAIATNGSIVVAVGAGGTIIHSADGITWTAATSVPTTENLYGVAYSTKGVWVAAGTNGTLLSSADGSTWTTQASGTTASLKSVSAIASTTNSVTTYTIVAAGTNGTLLTSTDYGVTWTAQTLGTADLNAVFASTRFVAVGSGGAIYTSDDAITWTPRTSPASTSMYGLIHANNIYTAVGAGSSSIYSY
jgi:hypothetical protein